jgi:hypothetical protein
MDARCKKCGGMVMFMALDIVQQIFTDSQNFGK